MEERSNGKSVRDLCQWAVPVPVTCSIAALVSKSSFEFESMQLPLSIKLHSLHTQLLTTSQVMILTVHHPLFHLHQELKEDVGKKVLRVHRKEVLRHSSKKNVKVLQARLLTQAEVGGGIISGNAGIGRGRVVLTRIPIPLVAYHRLQVLI